MCCSSSFTASGKTDPFGWRVGRPAVHLTERQKAAGSG